MRKRQYPIDKKVKKFFRMRRKRIENFFGDVISCGACVCPDSKKMCRQLVVCSKKIRSLKEENKRLKGTVRWMHETIWELHGRERRREKEKKETLC